MRQQTISVVIIDDDKMLCYLLTKALQFPEFGVVTAHDGASGIELVSQIKPQLVLLDIDLPDMNGFTVLSKVQGISAYSKVIMTSVIPIMQWRHYANEAHVDAVLPKPFSLHDLIDTIKKELDPVYDLNN